MSTTWIRRDSKKNPNRDSKERVFLDQEKIKLVKLWLESSARKESFCARCDDCIDSKNEKRFLNDVVIFLNC